MEPTKAWLDRHSQAATGNGDPIKGQHRSINLRHRSIDLQH